MFKQFKESGHLVDSFSVNSGFDLIKEAELFSVGIHRGRNYTVKDLQELANSFDAEERIPLQLDHSDSVRDTVGVLESVKVVGSKLMGTVRIIDEAIKEKVANKTAKKLSISFYTDSKGNPTKFREVSIVAFPQLKGAQMFSEQPQLDDRKQMLYEKAREFQLQMRFRALQAQVEKNKLKLEQAKKELANEKALAQAFREAREEAEYQSYMDKLNGKDTTKLTAEDEKYYQEYMNSMGLGQRR
ncbi:hypothetical protein ACQVPC_00345 [Bacillus mycoides]|uniref:hypothetical protein n=1 Tax=Bacillus mycoides TaxID=1405 RepID=UPI0021110C0F|nr:hypothetical protein [Bacillus mycoides]MCQ6565861.1 hypothetical protein [Bacillus mycoides]